jgi:hypothetical protein
MTTEAQLQAGIKASLQAITRFNVSSVTINSDVYLDGPIGRSPFFNILIADNFTIRQDTMTPTGTYQIPVIMYREFVDWEPTQNEFQADRQAIIDEFNEVGTARSCGGLDGVTINAIRTEGPVTGVAYDETSPALPVYLMQSLIFEVELF